MVEKLWVGGRRAVARVDQLGRLIHELTLAQDDPDVDDLGDGVAATRIIPDLHI
jgi:hypothetical protein